MSESAFSIKNIASLIRFRVSIPVSLSALCGYVVAAQSLETKAAFITIGVFLFSAASSVINQVQEYEYDKKMVRTQNRAIAKGLLKPKAAILIGLILLLMASILLIQLTYVITFFLGLFAMLWYNGVYTYLKRYTAFAVIPGALVGAIPPLMGFSATGLSPLHPHAIFLAFFFFIGQIPHFWIILIRRVDDYKNAGFATFPDQISLSDLLSINYIWIASTAVAAIMLAVFGSLQYLSLQILLISLASTLPIIFVYWLRGKEKPTLKVGFTVINMFYLLTMLVFILDSLG